MQSPDPCVTLVQGDATDAGSVAKVAHGADAVWKLEARRHRDALEICRRLTRGLESTLISPAAVIELSERTGSYRTGGDQMLFDDNGETTILFEDSAVALVDDLEQRRHIGRRITVAY